MNTKIFNTIQDLWDYCMDCPICHSRRTVIVRVNGQYDKPSWQKENEVLRIQSSFEVNSNKIPVQYIINCRDNTYQLFETKEIIPEEHFSEWEHRPSFFFWLESDCIQCESFTISRDIYMSNHKGQIIDVHLSRDRVYLIDETTHYIVSVFYQLSPPNRVLVTRMYPDGTYSEVITLPFLDLDLSNVEKSIRKIKTAILFS
jgi:hypothetical protein